MIPMKLVKQKQKRSTGTRVYFTTSRQPLRVENLSQLPRRKDAAWSPTYRGLKGVYVAQVAAVHVRCARYPMRTPSGCIRATSAAS